MVEIEDALAHADNTRLADLGHRLKSSARAVGAMGFAQLCEALEAQRGDADMAQATPVVVRLSALLELLGEHIEREVALPGA